MSRAIREDANPFTGGLVTDLDPTSLGGGFATRLENMVFTRNVAAKRGAPTYVGETPVVADPAVAVRSAMNIDDPTERLTLILQNVGGSGTNTRPVMIERTAGQFNYESQLGVYTLLRGPYRGEWLLCDETGERPIKRIVAGNPPSFTNPPAGTVTVTAGSTYVTGSGTNFLSAAPVNGFIAVYFNAGNTYGGVGAEFYRIMSVDSDTQLTVEHPFPFGAAGALWNMEALGVFGLHSVVADEGMVDFNTGTPGTATGRGTKFVDGNARQQESQNFGRISLIGRTKAAGGWTGATLMTNQFGSDGISTNTSSSITANVTGTSETQYRILRPLTGKVVEFHNQRIWAANLKNAPNRLQYGRIGSPFEIHDNGRDSLATDFIDAKSADWISVPSPYHEGEIIGLASSPGGALIVARSNNTYALWGDPPNEHIQLLSEGVGAIDPRAVTANEHGVFIANKVGFWRWPGSGGFRDLTFRKINGEYRDWIGPYERGRDRVVAFQSGEHVMVGGRVNGIYKLWGFWAGSDNFPCTGTYPGLNPIDVHDTHFSNRRPEAIWVQDTLTRPSTMLDVFEDQGQADQGDFGIQPALARTGEKLVGDEGDSTRVRRIRVTADLENSAGDSAQVEVRTGSSSVAVAAHRNIQSSLVDDHKVIVARPKTTEPTEGGILGRRVRSGFIEVAEAGDPPKVLRIHSIVTDARDKGKRV